MWEGWNRHFCNSCQGLCLSNKARTALKSWSHTAWMSFWRAWDAPSIWQTYYRFLCSSNLESLLKLISNLKVTIQVSSLVKLTLLKRSSIFNLKTYKFVCINKIQRNTRWLAIALEKDSGGMIYSSLLNHCRDGTSQRACAIWEVALIELKSDEGSHLRCPSHVEATMFRCEKFQGESHTPFSFCGAAASSGNLL